MNTQDEIDHLIEQIQLCRETQSKIDKMYDSLCNEIIEEMHAKLKTLYVNSSLKKRHRPKKTFWNDELEQLFGEVVS